MGNRDKFQNFIEELDKFLNKLIENKKSTEEIIIGNININFKEESICTKKYLNTLLSHGFL